MSAGEEIPEHEAFAERLVDSTERLYGKMDILDKSARRAARAEDYVHFNIAVLISWPLFSLFLLTQPWLSNWANNSWHRYSADYAVFNASGSVEGTYKRAGLCVTPAHEMHCTDGQNFTELALKYRGVAYGCGCGQGVLGEGLCPMTSYGHTLSDFVSTAPSIAAMLGLGFFPLQGTWRTTEVINKMARPSAAMAKYHGASLMMFQVSYIAWGMCSACVFPTSHAVLTVVFLFTYLKHWILTALICLAAWGFDALEARITFAVAVFSIVVILFGSIPRIFLTINDLTGVETFPNWNRGIGSYAFWFAEAAGLSATFGVYPMMLIGFCHPKYSPHKPEEFLLWPSSAAALDKDLDKDKDE